MSHLHIPDGLLPVWLWLAGMALAMAAVLLSLYMVRGMDLRKKIPLLGMMSAMMLVGMNLEIAAIAYHVNLSVLTGIILGPWLAVVAALIVNVLLAVVGHGGVTVAGLNTIIVGSEAVVGYFLFSMFRRFLKPGMAAGVSTFIALFVSTCMMLGVVVLANLDFSAPLAREMREVMETPTIATLSGAFRMKEDFNLKFFAVSALGLGAMGWFLESFITMVAVRFIAVVKPEILKAGNVKRP